MAIRTGNFAWHDWKTRGFAQDGDTFEGCNLSQRVPGTMIGLRADGNPAKGLVFRQSNLVNCKAPDDAKVEQCNTSQVDIDAVDAAMAQERVARQAALDAKLAETRTKLAATSLAVSADRGEIVVK